MNEHVVVKRNGRLRIERDGEMVYTPPAFLLPFIHNRKGMQDLAKALTDGVTYIKAVIAFETKMRP